MRLRASAFTKSELVSVLTVIGVLVFLFAPMIARTRAAVCRLTDSDHLRLIVQAMGVFSLANDGVYPLPGDLDSDGATLNGNAEEKNTTGQFLSMMIFGGHITPEMCVSPAELDTSVVLCEEYEYENPALAPRPTQALWDPAFSGTPGDSTISHNQGQSNQSYAPLAYFGSRRTERWRNRGDAPTALIANRGPKYQGTTYPEDGAWHLTDGYFGTESFTLYFYGAIDSWSGYVAYDDGSALFLDTPNPDRTTYERVGPAGPAPDNLFVDETDDISGPTNVFTRLNLLMRPVARIQSTGTYSTFYYWYD